MTKNPPKLRTHRLRYSIRTIQLAIIAIFCVSVFIGWAVTRFVQADQTFGTPVEEFGVHGAVPSLPTIEEKQLAINKIAGAGFGWMRHEFYYEKVVNFENYDVVQKKAKERGIKTLGLLSYPGKERSHDEWKNYVRDIVSHYANDVAAWEVMNEVDNYLTPAEYVVYLKEAHDIIRQISPNAVIVLSGITSRPESVKFWDGVASAGGWDYFNVVGLHHYHRQNPELVNFGGGDFTAELSRPIATIKKNGNNKKIWVTELGYMESVGRENQANWLARNLIIARSIPEVEKIFIYTLTNKNSDFPFGLLDKDLSDFPVYTAVSKVIQQLRSKPTGVRIISGDRKEVDSFQNLDGWSIPDKKNGEAELSAAGGTDGSAMQIDYNFSAEPAYVLAAKRIPLGQPQAIAAWFYGDDANNVWKFRFIDDKGETFQADLGAIPSGWNYKHFVLGSDTAIVSWNGDKVIDYPIDFDSIVIDRQEGKSEGTGIVDELTAVKSGANLMSYQFGTSLAYWSSSGNQKIELCGKSLEFTETPIFAENSSCTDPPKQGTTKAPPVAAALPPTPPPVPRKVRPKAPATVVVSPVPKDVDISKSTVKLVGQKIPANGYSHYQVAVTLKDANNTTITDLKPDVRTNTSNLKTIGPIQSNGEWFTHISSNQSGAYPLKVVARDKTINESSLTFYPVPKPSLELPGVIGYVYKQSQRQASPWLYLAGVALALVSVLCAATWGGIKLIHFVAPQAPTTITQEMVNYIHAALVRGTDKTDIMFSLRTAGWTRAQIDEAFNLF